MIFQITDDSTFCSTACPGQRQGIFSHQWLFVRGFPLGSVIVSFDLKYLAISLFVQQLIQANNNNKKKPSQASALLAFFGQ